MRNSSRFNRLRNKRRGGGINLKKVGTLITIVVFIVMVFTSIRFYTLFNTLRGSDSPTLWRPDSTRIQLLLVGRMNDSLVSCSVLSISATEGEPVYILRVPVQTLMNHDSSTQSFSQIVAESGIAAGVQSLNGLLLGQLPIEHHIVYEVEGLIELVEAVGGVEIDLPGGYQVNLEGEDYVFSSGTNLVSPDNLRPLIASADFEDTRFWAEKSLLVALFNDLFSFSNLGNLISNIKLVSEAHQTDMTPREMARFRDTLQAVNQENSSYLLLPGKAQGQYWSTDQYSIELAMMQIIEGVAPYDEETLIVDVFNGNGVSGFAGKTAAEIKSLNYTTGKVDNAQEVDTTKIYYLPEYKLAAMKLAFDLNIEAIFIEDQYSNSDNPIAIILGRDLIGR